MLTKEAKGTYVRWWLEHDSNYLAQIDRECFRRGELGKEDLSRVWDRGHFQAIRNQAGVWGQVAVRNARLRTNLNVIPGQIVGFVIYKLKDTEVVLERIAVSRSYQRVGIGTRLINKVKEKLYNRRHTITALIRESDNATRDFLRSQGFRASLKRDAFSEKFKDEKGKETVKKEDGYLMIYDVAKAEETIDLKRFPAAG